MVKEEKNRQGLLQEKARLEREIADTKKRFPAHSLKPALMNRLEELEESLAHIMNELRAN